MKRIIYFFAAVSLLFFSEPAYTQMGINTLSPHPSSSLDIVSSNTGLLIPRMTSAQRTSISSPATGLLVYDTTSKSFWYHNGIAWVEIEQDDTWTRNSTAFRTFLSNRTDSVGIGNKAPSHRLHVTDSNTVSNLPPMSLEQKGSGDASVSYHINTAGNETYYTLGNDQSDNYFRISDTSYLTGTSYTDPHTMMMISSANPGITHANHQSRSRAYLSGVSFTPALFGQPIPHNIWYAVSFDNITYDEHVEFIPGVVPGGPAPVPPPPVNPTPGQFKAKETGYYMIIARTEFISFEVLQSQNPAYVSIAIYLNGGVVAHGNKLNIFDSGGDQNGENDAPVVTDILFLNPNDIVEIYVYQNYSNPYSWILGFGAGMNKPAGSVTYVAVHKVS